ncbi:hypothetical protein EJB05_57270, partial [Eragrostis curvula]
MSGRLRGVEGGKLVVDCVGEGVLFVEADADVQLADLEAAGLRAPFPGMDELLFDMEGTSGVLNCPLLLIQVTRLNHTICDAVGIVQFMSAVGELAHGFPTVTVQPAWAHELLDARTPPNPALTLREFDDVPLPPPPSSEMVMRTFNFSRADMLSIKKRLPQNIQNSTVMSSEALTAALWRARTSRTVRETDVC